MDVAQIRAWASRADLLGIPLYNWLIALVAAAVAYGVLVFLLRVLLVRVARLSRRTQTTVDDGVVEIFRATRSWVLVVVAALIGLQMLELPSRWQDRISHLWFVVLVLQLALWGSRAILLLRTKLAEHAAVAQTSASATLMSWGLQTALWTTVLLAVLSNLGVNITALVTSLGVGGIAVALAVQNVLGDLFASLAIALDKPFEVGDGIAVNGVSGTVEKVGLKTTRIRAVGGEQIVMSNADLLKNSVSNYKRQTTRRIAFKFAVSYGTPASKAGQIPALVREIVEAQGQIRFDRAHLQRMGESGLEYEVVYIVETSDYNLYMDTQQRIYLALIEKLQALGVDFAMPKTMLVAPPSDAVRPEGGSGPLEFVRR